MLERRLSRQHHEQEPGERRPGVNVDLVVEVSDRPGHIILGSLTEKWLSPGVSEMWGVPGRDIIFGETFEAAARRNTQAELGCEASTLALLGPGENFESGEHYIGIVFAVSIKEEPKVMTPQDWKEWKWFPVVARHIRILLSNHLIYNPSFIVRNVE